MEASIIADFNMEVEVDCLVEYEEQGYYFG